MEKLRRLAEVKQERELFRRFQVDKERQEEERQKMEQDQRRREEEELNNAVVEGDNNMDNQVSQHKF